MKFYPVLILISRNIATRSCRIKMDPEDIVLRIAYFVLFITLALMSWALSVQAVASDMGEGSPCSFNLLCSCTKPGPYFGKVACHNVPFGNLPAALNSSRTFVLSMAYNDLRVLESKQLVSSGVWRLEVRNNGLHLIEDDAFLGLSNFLTELDLSNNELTNIPSSGMKTLSRLRDFNFNGNRLTDLSPEDWEGFPNTLTYISLADNFITSIPEAGFVSLPQLQRLDLSRNSIRLVHPQAFLGITDSLKILQLSGNLLRKIPYEAVSLLNLENLDLSHNLIHSTLDIFYSGKLSVGSLNLAFNQIPSIPFYALQNFGRLNSLNLSYNPIIILGDDAFKGANTKTLDLSHCFIQEIYPLAFRGLETSLRSLDLGFNNLSYWLPGLFSGLEGLRELVVENNGVGLAHEELTRMQLTLQRLSLMEDKENVATLDDLRLMSNLRELNLSSIQGMTTLSPNLFSGFGPNLQRVKISHAKIKTILGSAFAQLTGLKVLDLSDNRIGSFDQDAFQGMGHSTLTTLILINALRSNSISPTLLHPLTSLEYLDLSSNSLVSLPDEAFDHSPKLTHLNLRFNKLTSIPENLFQKTLSLEQLSIGFNQLMELPESSFAHLRSLQRLELNDNVITEVQSRAFRDLTSLQVITLAGNRLSRLEDETFSNLPALDLLDLSHNQLYSFNIGAFEQVGTLSSLKVDASWNNITSLGQAPWSQSLISGNGSHSTNGFVDPEHSTTNIPSFISSSSIEVLDLSRNNISYVASNFFAPISSSLLQLDLSWNSLKNLTHHHFSGMRFLQRLAVDFNLLDTVEYDTFRESRLIQVISLNDNLIRDLPPDLLENCTQVRIFSAAKNKIRSLADPLFKGTRLEMLNMAGNQLVRFPEAALSRVASTVVHLDLSSNELSSLIPSQIECLVRLRWISLANNRITVIGDTAFSSLQNLLHLDISGNPMGHLTARLFDHNRESLLHLNIANMSLSILPDFDVFPNLLTFNASHNSLAHLPTNFGVNVSNLRTLDVSGNEITASPNTVWHTIPRLHWVSLSDNPIRFLTNDSFLQLDHLHHLDISHLPLESLQTGVLRPMPCLKSLKIGPDLPTSPATVVHSMDSLQSFHLVVDTPELTPLDLGTTELPPKLSQLTLSGATLASISDGLLQGVTSRSFHLTIEDTSLVDLSRSVVSSMGDATDISLEVGGGNTDLRKIGNPNKLSRPQPFSTYLDQLSLPERSQISCSCDSGWIEFWLRQWISRTCPIRPDSMNSGSCDKFLKSLRTLQCENKSGMGLIQAFVTELECGWDNGCAITSFPGLHQFAIPVAVLVLMPLML